MRASPDSEHETAVGAVLQAEADVGGLVDAERFFEAAVDRAEAVRNAEVKRARTGRLDRMEVDEAGAFEGGDGEVLLVAGIDRTEHILRLQAAETGDEQKGTQEESEFHKRAMD